ncbi:class I SAM-dependent methyltransferase [Solibacillus sp. CAU 1738]|uniref:class I SAM-dependent methyltransferase n=1 Tax=Solibacillus sp. CAU 1738 TaxID=3140363 RepID=UPI0032610FB5
MAFIDPSTLKKWLSPHSIQWYKQLGELQEKYLYPWNSTVSDWNGESIFDKEVFQVIKNKKVIEIGCGHGDFTLKCSVVAKEIVGFDVTDQFIQVANENKKANVSFVVGNTKHGLPFEKDAFDCAIIRKGPTSAYPSLKKVVKKNGVVMGLHPGDQQGKELPVLFPNLFHCIKGTPILDTLNERLSASNFSSSKIEEINSIETIHSPLDVLKLCCFGQLPSVYETLKEKHLKEITTIFEQNATADGLPITFSRYIVRAII